MTLITCTECGREISDKAAFCTNCGYPIEGNPDFDLKRQFDNELQFPDIPPDPSIGTGLVNWLGDTYFTGEFFQDENVVDLIESGKVELDIHKEGISIRSSLLSTPYMELHFKQIINVKQTTKKEIINTNKSVIGRAVVGALLMGPVGAIVGGMSGINMGSAQNASYFVINYWDIKTKKAQTLLIRGGEE